MLFNSHNKAGAQSGRINDIETEISNHFGQLVSDASVLYNSRILLRQLKRFDAEGGPKGIGSLTRTSPKAWQHILVNGNHTTRAKLLAWIRGLQA
jgi:hypothetical protein